MRISSPPTIGPCYYGIDTPLKSELIASRHSRGGDPRARGGGQPRLPVAGGPAAGGGGCAGAAALHRLLLRPLPRGGVPGRRVAAPAVREGPGLGRDGAATARGGPRHLGPPARGRRAGRHRDLRRPHRAQAGLGRRDPHRGRPGVRRGRATCPACPSSATFCSATTRFRNDYEPGGTRRQVLMARADPISLSPLPEEWRTPDALLLGPVAGELRRVPGDRLRSGLRGGGSAGLAARRRRRGERLAPGLDATGARPLRRSRALPLAARPARRRRARRASSWSRCRSWPSREGGRA